MIKKILIVGTSHAGNFYRYIKEQQSHGKYLDYQFDFAALGVNAWYLIQAKARFYSEKQHLISNDTDVLQLLQERHRERCERLFAYLNRASTYDKIYFFDMFFKGWAVVPSYFKYHKKNDFYLMPNVKNGSECLASKELLKNIPNVCGCTENIKSTIYPAANKLGRQSSYEMLASVKSLMSVGSELLLFPAPMHPSVKTTAPQYEALTALICRDAGISYIAQHPATLNDNYGTLKGLSCTSKLVSQNIPTNLHEYDGHMTSEYWDLQHSLAGGLK